MMTSPGEEWQQLPFLGVYSNHPFKYASWLSAQFFWQKSRFIFYCLNMLCKVICCECMHFFRLTFDVSLSTFCWNIPNDHHTSSYICPVFIWTSEQRNWLSMLRVVLCRASKSLMSVGLPNSASVSIRWISVKRVASNLSVSRCVSSNQRV